MDNGCELLHVILWRMLMVINNYSIKEKKLQRTWYGFCVLTRFHCGATADTSIICLDSPTVALNLDLATRVETSLVSRLNETTSQYKMPENVLTSNMSCVNSSLLRNGGFQSCLISLDSDWAAISDNGNKKANGNLKKRKKKKSLGKRSRVKNRLRGQEVKRDNAKTKHAIIIQDNTVQ